MFRPPTRPHRSGIGPTIAILASVLCVAAYWRLTGFDWDEGVYLHPDERFLAMVASALEPVDSFATYLDTPRSGLNPNNEGFDFFVYGDLPVIAVSSLGRWFARPGNDIDRTLFGIDLSGKYADVYRIGRAISAAADLVVTLLVFAIGSDLYGRRVGLLASALYAGSVLPIQQSHFFTVDALANLFIALALWFAVRAVRSARWSDDVLFGVALGAGLATKVSVALAFLLLVLAVAVRYGVRAAARSGDGSAGAPHRSTRAALLVRGALSLNVTVLVAALTFRLLQPYAFLPHATGAPGGVLDVALDVVSPRLNPDWGAQMAAAAALQRGEYDTPSNHQWATRAPLVFALGNLVRFGLGWPLALTAFAGWAWALIAGLGGRSESWRHVLLVSWVGLCTAWYGAGWVASMRYLLPVYPGLAILAAWVLVRIAAPQHDASQPGLPVAPRWRRAAGFTAIAVVLVSTFAWATAFTGIYARPHTRLSASRWIYEHVPADLTLALETETGAATIQVGLPNNWMPPAGAADDIATPVTRIAADTAVSGQFSPAHSGRLVALDVHGVRAAAGERPAGTIEIEVASPQEHASAIRRCALAGAIAPSESRGATVACRIDAVDLAAGRKYTIAARSVDGSLVVAGAAIANEGSWDDALPLALWPHRPAESEYQIYALELAADDDEAKRHRLQEVLDRCDFITVSSNRFYDSLRRNPRRWPMTIDYYNALFSGTLGFRLVADFSSLPGLGPWRVDDRTAEEAFSVYDHPRVFVFRKTSAYDSAKTAAVIGAADLDRIERRIATRVTDAPVQLPIPPPLSVSASALSRER